MKIVSFLGSPKKKGNTAALLDSVLKGLHESAVVESEYFFLHDMKIAPCNGCDACKKANSTGCVIRDDMDLIYAALRKADIIILATPIYWWSVTAQMKLMIDRIYGMDFKCGRKKIALLMTYGGELPNSGPETLEKLFVEICDYLKMEAAGTLGVCTETLTVSKNEKALQDGLSFGAKLVK
ncbi:MAG TPA: flavodoxin family protein [Spirochaetota bacterium]|nr:flavodoxin family protein [Spirochaetota bacterium]HQO39877.1 flavodoxin family protein [Spirochaetota bacterium]